MKINIDFYEKIEGIDRKAWCEELYQNLLKIGQKGGFNGDDIAEFGHYADRQSLRRAIVAHQAGPAPLELALICAHLGCTVAEILPDMKKYI